MVDYITLVYQILSLIMLGALILIETISVVRKPYRSFDTRVSNGDTNVSLQTRLNQGDRTISIPPVHINAPVGGPLNTPLGPPIIPVPLQRN